MGRLYLSSTAISPERMPPKGDWLQAGRHELTFDISSLGPRLKLTKFDLVFSRGLELFPTSSVRIHNSALTVKNNYSFHRINKGT